MELGRPADVAQAAGALDRLESELVAVESARPFKVLSGELGDGVGDAKHGAYRRETPRGLTALATSRRHRPASRRIITKSGRERDTGARII